MWELYALFLTYPFPDKAYCLKYGLVDMLNAAIVKPGFADLLISCYAVPPTVCKILASLCCIS